MARDAARASGASKEEVNAAGHSAWHAARAASEAIQFHYNDATVLLLYEFDYTGRLGTLFGYTHTPVADIARLPLRLDDDDDTGLAAVI